MGFFNDVGDFPHDHPDKFKIFCLYVGVSAASFGVALWLDGTRAIQKERKTRIKADSVPMTEDELSEIAYNGTYQHWGDNLFKSVFWPWQIVGNLMPTIVKGSDYLFEWGGK